LVQVTTATGEVGRIEGSFGKSGKFKVSFPSSFQLPTKEAAGITLTFKRFLYDQDKRRMVQ
jgi:selenocysteine-specific elongation factor